MTKLQRKIFECLFRGGHIVKLTPGKDAPGQMILFDVEPTEAQGTPLFGTKVNPRPPESGRYSVREADLKLVSRINVKSTKFIFQYCRKVRKFKTTVYMINKQQVLTLNGNSWIKKTYKKTRDQEFGKRPPKHFSCPCALPAYSITKFNHNTN